MNERWKYQVKTGGFWGVFMIVFSALYNIKTQPIEQLITEWDFYFRSVCFILFGIFVLGYSSWKAKTRREENFKSKAKK